MTVATGNLTAWMSEFVAAGAPPGAARDRAAVAVCDTVGVGLAGAHEPAAQMVRAMVTADSRGPCRILGTGDRAGASEAAFANGVAAHALDFDDMCFVSMAHPSCALVPAVLAAAELASASGRTLLDAYVVGFEVEGRAALGLNPPPHHAR